MNLLNLSKFFNAIPPAAIKDDAAFASRVIDRADFMPSDAKGVLFIVQLGATDIAAAVLRVQESDTQSDATTLGGTPATIKDVTTKPGADDDNGLFGVYINAEEWQERYLQIQATAGDGSAGTFLTALAIADHPGNNEVTAAGLGLTSLEIE